MSPEQEAKFEARYKAEQEAKFEARYKAEQEALKKQEPKETTFVDGAVNLGKGLVRGARDLIDGPALWAAKGFDAITGSNEAERVSEINKQSEKEYQDETKGSTAAGTGRVISNVVQAWLPLSVASKVGNIAKLPTYAKLPLAGAAWGAADTRTLDDDAATNAAVGATLGGVLGTGAKFLSKPFGTQVAKEAPKIIDDAAKMGLPVSAANVVQAAAPNSIKNRVVQHITMPGQYQVDAIDNAVAKQIGKGVGVDNATKIDSTLINDIKPFAKFDNITEGMKIPLNKAELTNDLASALEKYKTHTIRPEQKVLDEIEGLVSRAGDDVSPSMLQSWRSELGKSVENATPEAQQLFGKTRELVANKMAKHLSPEQQEAFAKANEMWRNQQVIKDVLNKSGVGSNITPRQIAISARNSSVGDEFVKGKAPYQELSDQLLKLYGTNGIQPAKLVSGSDLVAGVGFGGEGLLAKKLAEIVAGKSLSNTNSKMRNMLVGNTTPQRLLDMVTTPSAPLYAARLAAEINNPDNK